MVFCFGFAPCCDPSLHVALSVQHNPTHPPTHQQQNAIFPDYFSIIAHYLPVRNRKVNEALVQGVETARAVLTTTPQGHAADAQFVKWLMDHQKEAGVFATVSALVDQVSDNPAAKMTAQEIAARVQRAGQQSSGAQAA